MNKYADDNLSSQQDEPRRKLAFGVVALVAVLAFGLCLDAVSCSMQRQDDAAETAAAATNDAGEGGADDATTDGNETNESVTTVNGVAIVAATKLEGFDDTMLSACAKALASWANSHDVELSGAKFVATSATVTSADASASFTVKGTDTKLTATLGNNGGAGEDSANKAKTTATTEAATKTSITDADALKDVFGDDASKLAEALADFLKASGSSEDAAKATIGDVTPVKGSASESFTGTAGATKFGCTYDPDAHTFTFTLL